MTISKNGSTPLALNTDLVPSTGIGAFVASGTNAGTYTASGLTLRAGVYAYNTSAASRLTINSQTPSGTANVLRFTTTVTSFTLTFSGVWTNGPTTSYRAVASAPSGTEQFVAATTTTNAIQTSTDGITWTTRTVTGTWNGAAAGNSETNKYVLAGAARRYARSTDGVTWTTASLLSPFTDTDELVDALYDTDTYVLVSSNNGYAAYSTDGTTWSTATPPTQAGATVGGTFNGATQRFWLGGASGYTRSSTDGITWVARTPGVAQTTYAIGGGGGKLFASYGNASTVQSTDGTTWSAGPAAIQRVMNRFFYTSSGTYKYLAADNGTRLYYSTDGVTWAYLENTQPSTHEDFAFNGTRYVAVGAGGLSYATNVLGVTSADYTMTLVGPITEATLV